MRGRPGCYGLDRIPATPEATEAVAIDGHAVVSPWREAREGNHGLPDAHPGVGFVRRAAPVAERGQGVVSLDRIPSLTEGLQAELGVPGLFDGLGAGRVKPDRTPAGGVSFAATVGAAQPMASPSAMSACYSGHDRGLEVHDAGRDSAEAAGPRGMLRYRVSTGDSR